MSFVFAGMFIQVRYFVSDVGPTVHADEPPCHTCKECGKTFRLHSWLVKHRAGHRLQYNQPTVPLNGEYYVIIISCYTTVEPAMSSHSYEQPTSHWRPLGHPPKWHFVYK